VIERSSHRVIDNPTAPIARSPDRSMTELPPTDPRIALYLLTQGIRTVALTANWQEQLRRGTLDMAVLLSVVSGPRYGLQIIKHLEAFTDLVLTEGTIYPLLARLAREGLLTSYWVSDEAPHPRKYYRLTPRGRAQLGQMCREFRDFTSKIHRLIDTTRDRNGAE
jgi:PadR family transcriptional regulator PadR